MTSINGEIEATQKKKIMAIASGGGHWVQLLRLRRLFDLHHTFYVTVQPDYKNEVDSNSSFYTVTDATRWSKFSLLRMILEVLWIVLKERPDIIVTTGAAPGVAAIRAGKLFGAKTVWIDSIANIDQMSMSGIKIQPYADLWLTHWEHLAMPEGPTFLGAVL
jgi:UDP-N-acetylglucosamine:LPS N-acetylglucosamine transferase